MNRPKMILFDYGGTLLYEPKFDLLRGERAVFRYIKENPQNVTPEQAHSHDKELFENADKCRAMGYECHEWPLLRCKYESLNITFQIPLEEVETVLWDNTSPGGKMPYISELLEFLERSQIRTGVISNIGWSGNALARRINRLLPENRFEFILASSEYAVRKPNPLLFRIALNKAGLSPEEVWYCGDSIQPDVFGAHGAGIFPVLYQGEFPEELERTLRAQPPGEIDFPYLHIRDWREMISVLEKC
ncbi:MAG: HAD-IA family hydrolase [Oscillospiraceae bacterium]|jgi:putative hydrolase of the HAD superfamily|nr:HAD-IA family hydrolase [Oscillospiraceae bacterium]